MTRVSENSAHHAIKYSAGKVKSKVEDLQIRGSTLKRIMKPSDDTVGHVDLLQIRSQNIDAQQYLKSLQYAQTALSFTETAVGELTDILSKAKEIAIGQASDIYNPEVRINVAKEVHQLRLQALHIANKRMGNRYIFAGQKLLTRPFNEEGQYFGDNKRIHVEINKDTFIPMNVTGADLFFDNTKKPSSKIYQPQFPDDEKKPIEPLPNRSLASDQPDMSEEVISSSIFDELASLENALLTDNSKVVQSLLEKLDRSLDRVISTQAKLGALSNHISNAETNIEKLKLLNEEYKSRIEDADVAELFSNLQKEQAILKASYQASGTMMNTKLIDFLR